MTATRVFLAVAVAAVLRVLLGLWEPASRVVDPFLVLAVVFGLGLPRVPALFAGLLAGLVQDTWWSAWFGLHGFTKVVVAYAASALGSRLDVSQTPARVVVLAAASAADRALQLALGAAMGRTLPAPAPAEWLLAAGSTVVLGLMLFWLTDRLAARR